MAICLTVIMGFAALGFDLAYVRYARLELQNATDAAAHAALIRLRSTGNVNLAAQSAIAVAAQNQVWGKSFTLRTGDLSFGGWNFATQVFTANTSPANAVKITGARSAQSADGAIGLSFGQVLGQSSVNLTHVGIAAYRIRSIVVAQDITGTFWSAIDPGVNADLTMLDALHSYNIPADRIGMQLFTGAATLFTPLTNVQTGYSTVRNQWQGDGKLFDDATKTSGISLCNKLDINPNEAIPYKHAWMPRCTVGGDGTSQGEAIRSATDQLLTGSQPYETRVIVLITDGQAECCTLVGLTMVCNNTDACSQSRAQYAVTMANAADAQGINIFTVSLGADPAQSAYNASLVRGIGTSYNTPDPTQLQAILTQIAGAIPIALVR